MIRAASGEPEFIYEVEPPLKTEAVTKPKTEIDEVMEEINKLRK